METPNLTLQKSDVETMANRHPWKPFHLIFVQKGTRGNRSDVETSAMGIRRNERMGSTGTQNRQLGTRGNHFRNSGGKVRRGNVAPGFHGYPSTDGVSTGTRLGTRGNQHARSDVETGTRGNQLPATNLQNNQPRTFQNKASTNLFTTKQPRIFLQLTNTSCAHQDCSRGASNVGGEPPKHMLNSYEDYKNGR